MGLGIMTAGFPGLNHAVAQLEVKAVERFCVLLEPKFQGADIFKMIPGAKRTGFVAARETPEGVAYYEEEEFEKLGLEWEAFFAKGRESADRLLADLKPEYERDHRGVAHYAVLRSRNPRTAGVVLATGFGELFEDVLGEELIVVIPDRFTVYVFPRYGGDYAEYGEAMIEMYEDAIYPVSLEVFTLDGKGLRVIGAYRAD